MPVRIFSASRAGLALLLLAAASPAQPLLTPEEAVRIGLENNHDISLARDQSAIAANNRKAGVGPFLPEVSASAVHGGDVGESGSTALGASAGLLVFDGFQSWHAYQRLKSQEASVRLAERMALESTLEGILGAYYGIVQQERRLASLKELLAVSGERARLAQARMEVGAGSKLEQLQALSDLNADSSAWLSQQASVREAKVRLNQILARDPAADFAVSDTIPLDPALPVDAWRSGLLENNAAIRQARIQRGAAASGLKAARGGWWPDLNAGLRYSTTPEALAGGDPALGRDEGAGWSLSLSVPVFDRLRTRREVGNARLEVRQEETRLRQREQEAAAAFAQSFERHASGIRRVTLEERNLEVATLQAEAARERYRLGASSPLEFRDAQTRLLDARSRLASARTETKLAELALKRLAGVLVQDAPGRK